MNTRILAATAIVAMTAGGLYLFQQDTSRDMPSASARDISPRTASAQSQRDARPGAREEKNTARFTASGIRPLINADHVMDGRVFARIEEKLPFKLLDEASVHRFLIEQATLALGLDGGDSLAHQSTTHDELGNRYYKYAQRYLGLPVFGREMVVQVGASGDALLVAGNFESNIRLPVSPRLEGKPAVLGALGGDGRSAPIGQPALLDKPALIVYADENTPPVLAYRAVVDYTSDSGHHKDQIFVDANSGKLVASIPMLHSAFNSQLYTLNQKCISGAGDLPGSSVAASADAHTQGADKQIASTYWFYKNFLGRDSLDNQGMTLKASLHARFQNSSGTCDGQNAMFDTSTWLAIFGEGGSDMSTPSAAPDLVAHELTHGITGKTSNLTYKDESGALNEAMSDIMGSVAEAWSAGGGNASGNPGSGIAPNDNTWIMGDSLAPAGNIKFKRYFNNPTADGHSKDNYPERYTGSNDNGGVHSNSGILNLAFYLLSQGGTHPRSSVSTVNVPAIGMEKATKIYYHANTNLFTSSTNFASARNLLAQSAETLYGKCSTEYRSVQLSFDAVKVSGTWNCDGGTGGGTPPQPAPSGNLLTGSAITASSTYSSGYAAPNMLDGSLSTAWSSAYRPPYQQWVQIDMKSSKNVGSVTIAWAGNNVPRHFTVGAYLNNTWTPLKDIWNSSATSTQSVTLNTTARYLMITMDSGAFSDYYGISELSAR